MIESVGKNSLSSCLKDLENVPNIQTICKNRFFKHSRCRKIPRRIFAEKTREQESHPPLGIRLDSPLPPLYPFLFPNYESHFLSPHEFTKATREEKKRHFPPKEEEPMKNEKKPFEKRELGIKKGGGGGRETTVKMILPHLRT